MKSLKSTALLILIGTQVISGCHQHLENEKSIADQQLDKLISPWRASSVTLDGTAKDTYGNFKITLTGSQGVKTFDYATDGRPPLSPWPSSGHFTFDEGSPTTILTRDDQVAITYD